jgi:hypothetical protein
MYKLRQLLEVAVVVVMVGRVQVKLVRQETRRQHHQVKAIAAAMAGLLMENSPAVVAVVLAQLVEMQ